MDLLLKILPFALPLLLGAIIGYITNALAIKMLFRPYKKLRFLGIPLPFTPGIIPKQRKELAVSIGKMVSNELLTEDAVRTQIYMDSFKQGLVNSIKSYLESLFSVELNSFFNNKKVKQNEATENLINILLEGIDNFIKSENFSDLLYKLVKEVSDALYKNDIEIFFPDDYSKEKAISKFVDYITDSGQKEKLLKQIDFWFLQTMKNNNAIAEIIDQKMISRFVSFVDYVYPSLVDLLLNWLNSEETRKDLTERGSRLLTEIIDRLNGFQKFIVMAGQYKITLEKNMDSIVDDFILELNNTAKSDKNRNSLMTTIEDKLLSFREFGVNEVVKNKSEVRESVLNFASTLFDVFASAESKADLVLKINQSSILKENTLGSIAEKYFSLSSENLSKYICSLISGNPDQKKKSILGDSFSIFLDVVKESLGSKNLSSLFGFSDKELKRISVSIAESLILLINDKIPDILTTINIKKLVIDKVDSLNIKEVEGLLLIVIQKHLRWINLFGAILGALIGAIQVFSNLIL